MKMTQLIGVLLFIALMVCPCIAQEEVSACAYLSDLKAYRSTGDIWYDGDGGMSMGNIDYPEGVQFLTGNEIDFNLNGEYLQLTGMVGIDDVNVLTLGTVAVQIIGDGILLQEMEFLEGDLPVPVNMNVEGVRRLTFTSSCNDCESGGSKYVDLANMALYC